MQINSLDSSVQIQQILPEYFIGPVPLQPYIIATISKQKAHQIVQLLRKLCPLPPDCQLKRIKPQPESQTLEILLVPADNPDLFNSILDNHVIRESIITTETKLIPKSSIQTQAQYQEACKIWPISTFRSDFEIIDHTMAETQLLLKVLLEKLSKKQQEQELVLFTFEEGILFSSSGTCRNSSVASHGVMRLAEEWPRTQIFNRQLNRVQSKVKQLQKSNNKINEEDLQRSSLDRYYYFTGLNLLTRGNLCEMCAMALVHSRINRVYCFAESSQQFSKEPDIREICYNMKLNHHFSLFRVTHKI